MRRYAAIGLLALAANAAMVEPMSIEQMAASATAVVRASVGEASTSRSGPLIFTDHDLQIVETLAGDADGLGLVSVPGGVNKGVSQHFAGVPKLRAGGDYVLFLWRGPSGRVQLVGLAQGVFAVEGDTDTRVRAASGESMSLDALRGEIRAAADKAGASQ